MKEKQLLGLLSFLCFYVSAGAVHWFITPHPNATQSHAWAVAAQLLLGVAFGVMLYRKSRRASA